MDTRSPNFLAAPPQSLQIHDASLGRSLEGAPHFSSHSSQFHQEIQNVGAPSQAATNTAKFTREYNFLTSPTPVQQFALAILQDFENHVVLAWLTGLRSFKSDEDHWFQPGNLSSEQFGAISVLKDCPDELVLTWLDTARFGGVFDGANRLSGSSHRGSRTASAIQYPLSRQGPSNTPRSSAESFGGLPSPYDCNTLPTTPMSSRSRDALLDLSTETSTDEATQPVTTSHSHWCFICPNPRVITTCDGWKRHMKEHETRYRCMPNGPIEYTASGARCAFCGFPNPSQSHCDLHKAFPCANRTFDVRSYTRKPHFITHLKTHNISNIHELAERWKDTIKKRHFACGFCISHFHSLIEQLNHIDVAHYRLFHHIQDWDPNKVIRGLLLQPGVSESWQRILASHPGLMEPLLRWDVSVVRKLQFRLEVGHESADILAELAFSEKTYDPSHHGDIETFEAAGISAYDGVTTTQEAPAIQATGPRYFGLGERPVFDGDELTSPPSQIEPWALADGLMPSHNNYMAPSDSDEAQENTAMRMRQAQLDTGQNLVTSGHNYGPNRNQALSHPGCSLNPRVRTPLPE